MLNDAKLKELRQSVELVISENKYFEKVFNKLLISNQQLNSQFINIIHPQTTIIKNNNTRENLKRKLRFKLGCIIICLRKLTNTCSKSFLNESYQLNLLTDTILNHMHENDEYKTSDIENVDYEELNEFNFMDSTQDELDIEGEEENDEEDENFYIDDPFVNVSVDIKEFKRFYVFNYILEEFGNTLDDRFLAEYSEDAAKNFENELEGHVEDLRRDFVHIDKCVKELRIAIAREWLNKYEEKIFQNKYGQKLLNINYLEENEEK